MKKINFSFKWDYVDNLTSDNISEWMNTTKPLSEVYKEVYK